MNTKLKKLRLEKNIKQETMAKLLNMSISAYSRKENGVRSFTIDEASIVARYFGVGIEELFLG